jgi:hypothetical protein
MESVVELAARVPYRQVGQTMTKLRAGVLSAVTIHRLAQKAGDRALVMEAHLLSHIGCLSYVTYMTERDEGM